MESQSCTPTNCNNNKQKCLRFISLEFEFVFSFVLCAVSFDSLLLVTFVIRFWLTFAKSMNGRLINGWSEMKCFFDRLITFRTLWEFTRLGYGNNVFMRVYLRFVSEPLWNNGCFVNITFNQKNLISVWRIIASLYPDCEQYLSFEWSTISIGGETG